MASGYYSFVAGAIPAATDWNDYVAKQIVGTYASDAARDSALSAVLREGLHAYTSDNNRLYVYTGAAWEIVSEPPQTWTISTITQSGSVNVTATNGWYRRSMGQFEAGINLSITSAGTTNNSIVVATPITISSSTAIWGEGLYFDAGNQYYKLTVVSLSTTTFQFAQHSGNDVFGKSPNFAAANTDGLNIRISGRY